ncbi:MAG: NAD-dependent epimerase/dehydratase family protein [bacterium]
MKQKGKKVLITGADGFVGSHLCRHLLQKGYSVIGLAFRDKQKLGHLRKNKNFQIVEGDIRNFDKVFKILKEHKPEGIFHTAAILPSEKENDNPFNFFEVNAIGTLNLLEACRILNIKKFIYSSSTTVYGRSKKCLRADERHPVNPSDFYELTKLEGENFCKLYSKKYGIKTIILRYSGVFGLGKNQGAVATFVKNALSGKPLNIFNNTSWDIIYIEDAVKANILALEKLGKLNFEVINIASGREINIKDLAQKIIKISGSNSKIKINKFLSSFCLSANSNKAQRILKFKPTPLDKALDKYIKEIKNLIVLKNDNHNPSA